MPRLPLSWCGRHCSFLAPRGKLLAPLLFPGATQSVRITLSSDFPWISKSTSFVRQRRTEHLLGTPALFYNLERQMVAYFLGNVGRKQTHDK